MRSALSSANVKKWIFTRIVGQTFLSANAPWKTRQTRMSASPYSTTMADGRKNQLVSQDIIFRRFVSASGCDGSAASAENLSLIRAR
jgi:hypothetical protein